MTVHEIQKIPDFSVINLEPDREVSTVFCCDLLSVAMARAPEDAVWITVIGNLNVIAVASLAGVSCVVLAEGYSFDPAAVEAANGKVTLMKCPLPVYETAVKIGSQL